MASIEAIAKFCKEIYRDIKTEGTDNLQTLLYFFICLGFFLLAFSFSFP
ncbi:MAG: hypothetical protein U9N45_05525 [Gemmatimonadota bacterium]|nr:hypothetical protein [Gemmatimonadota bacterium]